MATVDEKIETNQWDSIEDVIAILRKVATREWTWSRNTECKYLDLRLDMRDGGCIIKNREGVRISPEYLAWQYSKETPEPPKGGKASKA